MQHDSLLPPQTRPRAENSGGTFGGGGDDVREHAVAQRVLALHLDLVGVLGVQVVDGHAGCPLWLHLDLGPGAGAKAAVPVGAGKGKLGEPFLLSMTRA